MEGGPPMFTRSFTSTALLYGWPATAVQDFHLLRSTFPGRSYSYWFIRFRSPLLTESLLLSFPPVNEMFQFTGFASIPYAFRYG